MSSSAPAFTVPAVAPGTSAPTNYRWTICALLFFATTINYIDRQVLALLKPILDQQLHWNNAQYANVMAAFQGAYAIGLLGFGRLIDRVGIKVGYGISIVAWSLSAMGHAFASSISGFLVARICLGLGEGGNFPSAVKAVAVWFPRSERAFATSIFNAGTNVGALIAPAFIPWIALTFGWQWAFVTTGIASFTWLFLLWIPLYDSPDRQRRANAAELLLIHSGSEPSASDAGGVSWSALLKHRQAWSFVVAKFATDPIWWFFLTWLPDFFNTSRHLDIKHSWLHLVTIYAIVTVFSILGGWVTGYLTNRGWSVTRARKTGMLLFAGLVVPIVAAGSVGNWPAVLLIGLAGAAHQAWSANLYTTVSDMFPKRAVASLIGIGGMAGAVGGILFQKFTGWLLDNFNAATGYSVLFMICGFAYLITFAIHHILAPRFEPVAMDENLGSC